MSGSLPPRPVRGCSPLPGEHSAGMRDQQVVGTPSSGGSMPSLIDMSQHSGDVGMELGDGMNQLRGDQTLNYDQRSVNFDQRSVGVEHHTHGVNPELLTNMTVAAASAELRAQATQEVAGLREAAISAVHQTLEPKQFKQWQMQESKRRKRKPRHWGPLPKSSAYSICWSYPKGRTNF